MSEIAVAEEDLSKYSRPELEAKLREWFHIALDTRDVRDELAADLETALNLCRAYQGHLAVASMPDPSLVEVRNLLRKYQMDVAPAAQGFRIFVDGIEITEHPDSILGDADELHLTSGEYYGVDRAELVQEEDGTLHFMLVEEGIRQEPVDALVVEPEPIEPAPRESREWLQEFHREALGEHRWEDDGGPVNDD